MDKKIKIVINAKHLLAKEGQTIFDAAKENGIKIPVLCHHPDIKVRANCRICLVEIKGEKNLQTACSTKVREGMEILTHVPKIHRARKFNLEFIFSQHQRKCSHCVWRRGCRLLNLAEEYNVKITRFKNRKAKRKVYEFGPIVFDGKKCIDCRNCLEICPVDYLKIKDKGPATEIIPSLQRKEECIYCGQCIVHCPAGVIETDKKFGDLLPSLRKNKILVAQFAPSIRATIGEEFGFPYGENVTDRITAGLRKLGFHKVFDTSVGADLTTTEEADELIERLKHHRHLPMFTSCCPSWVRFVEFYYPEFIPHLTTVRSPHINLGGIAKTYLAQKEKIDIKKIIVFSVMPCTAKKYEITRKELKVHGVPPVDHVLTTRELAFVFKNYGVDLKKIHPKNEDRPFGDFSGAGVIYGASGGVMESTLRTAVEKLTGKITHLEFQQVRGIEGIKKATIKVGGKELRVAVVAGIRNAYQILEEIKKNPHAFHYVEFMACPGGCIGGGGQPTPVDDEIRKIRAASLYRIDQTRKVRLSHKNPFIAKIYQEFSEKEIHYLTHTKFSAKKKERIKIFRIFKEPLWKKLKFKF